MTDNPAEATERRAARRRWVTLGEFVAADWLIVAALLFGHATIAS